MSSYLSSPPDELRVRHLKTNPLAIWLRCVCLSVVAILVVGGITRLTGSGLSMVDWRPIAGILPPITDAQWNEVFDQYKGSPEYQKVNAGMSMEAFKDIFFWEYLHRIMGRIVGLLCLLPYLWFLFRKKLTGNLRLKGLLLVLLVGVQGLMGWYMVKSGLVSNPEVSHYRLAAHLGLAFTVFGLAWWMLQDLKPVSKEATGTGKLRLFACGILCLLCLQIVYGAFTSGMKAGYGFNTFPMMEEDWVPEGLFGLSPFWQNFVADKFSVQFIHRWMGTVLVLATLGMGWFSFKSVDLTETQKSRLRWVLGLVVTQFSLGVVTILIIIDFPILLPVVHQLVALFLFAALLAFIHSLGTGPGKAQSVARKEQGAI
jgi:cytochrome c oxidase assembly protein subunit 15